MRREDRHGAVAVVSILLSLLPGGPALGEVTPPRLLAPSEARIAEFARRGAMHLLRSAQCQRVLTDFRDPSGRSLAENLTPFALSADEYLARIHLLDGTGHPTCKAGAELFTTRGAGGVFVCKRFLHTVWQQRTQAEVYVIHEMLHTLGLGENPPSSLDITKQVIRRCAP